MIKLILDDFNGALSEEQRIKSEKIIKDDLSQTIKADNNKYLEWVRDFFASKDL
jgi:hypothetical protein